MLFHSLCPLSEERSKKALPDLLCVLKPPSRPKTKNRSSVTILADEEEGDDESDLSVAKGTTAKLERPAPTGNPDVAHVSHERVSKTKECTSKVR